MALVVIDVTRAAPRIAGKLQRLMVEIRSGLFVGNLSKRTMEQLWAMIEDGEKSSAAMCYPAKNEMGFNIKTCGSSRYQVVDNYGIPLVCFVLNSKNKKKQ